MSDKSRHSRVPAPAEAGGGNPEKPRHSRAGGNPGHSRRKLWVPASAGMTLLRHLRRDDGDLRGDDGHLHWNDGELRWDDDAQRKDGAIR